jgi:hypothetical protein
MKKYLILALCFTSMSSFAGNFTSAAIPKKIDIIQAGTAGFMLYGEFGNVLGCTVADLVYVKATHPQYNQIYSTALAAMMAGKKIYLYATACEPVGWYSVPSTTYNVLNESGSLSISN